MTDAAASATDLPAPQPARRLLRYSLRTILVLVTLLAVACGWLKSLNDRAKRQRLAVEMLDEYGAEFVYRHEEGPRSGADSFLERWVPGWIYSRLDEHCFRTVGTVRWWGMNPSKMRNVTDE